MPTDPDRRAASAQPAPGAPGAATPGARGSELRPQPPAPARRRQLKVIGRQPLEAAFEAALSRSLRRHAPHLPPRAVTAIQEQAFREFMQLVGRKVRNVNGVSKRDFLAELERSHADALRERERVRHELERLQLRAEVLRRTTTSQEPNAASPLSEGLQELFRRAERGEMDLASLEQEVELVAKEFATVDRERSLSEYDQQIELFERRIAKLNSSLKQSEETIEALARSKTVDPGIASIYRDVQGLSEQDAQHDMKHELLVKLFEANLALREHATA